MAVMAIAYDEQVEPLLPRTGEWTVDDLDGLPDDGLQYELFDGVLVVSPAPIPVHQDILRELVLLMCAACPRELKVYFAPLDYRPDRRKSVQPDLLVVHREDVGEKNIVEPLLLAVEVLSDSTRSKDLLLKRDLYARTAVASYWVLDPRGPALVAYDLRDGVYVEVARAAGEEEAVLTLPFPVTVRPAALLD